MTMTERQRVFVSPLVQAQARDAVTRVQDDPSSLTEISTAHLPTELLQTLTSVLEAVAEGRSVVVGAAPENLTTTEAAAVLGVSRPTLMKFIRSGELPSFKIGTHHRVTTRDVTRLRRRRLAEQRAAFDEMRRLDDLLGH